MELSIFELSNKIKFSDQYVNVLEIENKKFYVDVIKRFYQLFNDEKISQPFVIEENNNSYILENDFLIVDNPFMLSYINKIVNSKIQKFIFEKAQESEELKEIDILIEKIKLKFGDIFVDLNLDLIYNQSIGSLDFLKLLTPKIDFVDFSSIVNVYKNLLNILSQLNLYKFIVFVGLRNYLDDRDIVEIYKFAKIYGINLLVIENFKSDLLPYENKLIVDQDLFELNIY